MGKGQWDLFEPRTQYVVQQSFKSLSDAFQEGERLTFVYATHNARRNAAAFFFTDRNGMSRRCELHGDDFGHIKANLHHWFAPEAPA